MNRTRLEHMFPRWANSNSKYYKAANKEASLAKVNEKLEKLTAEKAPNRNAWFTEKKAIIEAL